MTPTTQTLELTDTEKDALGNAICIYEEEYNGDGTAYNLPLSNSMTLHTNQLETVYHIVGMTNACYYEGEHDPTRNLLDKLHPLVT